MWVRGVKLKIIRVVEQAKKIGVFGVFYDHRKIDFAIDLGPKNENENNPNPPIFHFFSKKFLDPKKIR